MIHSGSRNFGSRIANHFQKKARQNQPPNHRGKDYRDLEFLSVASQDGQDYLDAARFAQAYAA